MKRVLITGASSGIGQALALQYAQENESVIACGRSIEKLESLNRQSPNISSLSFDVTDNKQVAGASEQVEKLDIVILNAGGCEYIDNADAFDGALFERVITTNLISIGYCLQHFLPKLSCGGQLVLVSSSAAFLPLPRAEAYGTSKAGLSYLAKTLAVDLQAKNIGVSLVHPGFVATPLTDKNDFPMPMKVTAEQAANYIIDGVNKGRFDIHFPGIFTYSMKLLALMPFNLWRLLANRMVRK